MVLSCDGAYSVFLCMVDSMKRLASVGLAQARHNYHSSMNKGIVVFDIYKT